MHVKSHSKFLWNSFEAPLFERKKKLEWIKIKYGIFIGTKIVFDHILNIGMTKKITKEKKN